MRNAVGTGFKIAALGALLWVGCGSDTPIQPTLSQASTDGDFSGADVIAPDPDAASQDTGGGDGTDGDGGGTGVDVPGVCTADSECNDADPCTIDRCEDGACSNLAGSCCSEDEQCDDDNPCSFDFCEEGQCKHSPQTDCCENDAQCDDGKPCTKDVCLMGIGACQSAPIAGCCTVDAACDDGDPCTADSCQDNVCQSAPGTCCDTDAQCNDGNGCTTDSCGDDGLCDNVVTPGCCNNDSECDDMDPCTVDLCFGGQCLSSAPGGDCCQSDEACEDQNPCTDNACVAGQCTSTPAEGPCCESDDECDDGNACTVGSCTEGGCEYEAVPGCCSADADCDDGDACTFDLCFGNECLNSEPSSGCCDTDQECNDGNVCTTEACVDGVCKTSAVVGCCNTNADCAVADSCQVGTCQGGTCAFAPDPACCTGHADCSDGKACTTDTCHSDGNCTNAWIAGCCEKNGDCTDGDGCTTDTCGNGKCVHTPVPNCCDASAGTQIAHFEFVPNQVDGVVFNPSSNAYFRWRESTNDPFAGSATMYYGNSNGDGYCQANVFGGTTSGTATLPVESQPYPSGVLDIPAGTTATVSFQAKLEIRSQADVDQLTLSVLPAGGQPTEVWSKAQLKAAQYGDWVAVKVDLSAFAGQQVQLRFSFSVVDASAHGGCVGDGPRIDEVKVTVSDCDAPKECPGGCDDGVACTEDKCVGGVCQNQPLAGCCNNDNDCASDNPCLLGACNAGQCAFQVKDADGCCQQAQECPGADQFCGEAVTCEQSQCSLAPSTKAETLMNFVFTSQVDGWDSGQGNNYRWREIDTKSVSPSRSMYFGNDDGDHYCGLGLSAPTGVASLPGGPSPLFPTGGIAFDGSGKTTLSFNVYVDVRKNGSVDQLSVRLDPTQGPDIVVWSKANLANNQYETWVPVTIDLTPYAPFEGRVRVIFDVVDVFQSGGCYLGGEGVHLDDLKVVHSCAQ